MSKVAINIDQPTKLAEKFKTFSKTPCTNSNLTKILVLKSDKVYSLNKETELLELQNIDEIVDLQYTGKVYSLSSNRIDFRFTEGHTVLYKNIIARNITHNTMTMAN